MKVLIWIGCILIASIIKVLVAGNGSMGAIPTMILYGAMFAAAGGLCKAWDNRKTSKEAPDDSTLATENLVNSPEDATSIGYMTSPVAEAEETPHLAMPPISFCRKCGLKLIDDSDFCSHCGTPIIVNDAEVQNETIPS